MRGIRSSRGARYRGLGPQRLVVGCPRAPEDRLDAHHGFATRLLESGINPKIASEMLGHSSIAFTLHVYSHSSPGMTALGAAAIQKALWGDLP